MLALTPELVQQGIDPANLQHIGFANYFNGLTKWYLEASILILKHFFLNFLSEFESRLKFLDFHADSKNIYLIGLLTCAFTVHETYTNCLCGVHRANMSTNLIFLTMSEKMAENLKGMYILDACRHKFSISCSKDAPLLRKIWYILSQILAWEFFIQLTDGSELKKLLARALKMET